MHLSQLSRPRRLLLLLEPPYQCNPTENCTLCYVVVVDAFVVFRSFVRVCQWPSLCLSPSHSFILSYSICDECSRVHEASVGGCRSACDIFILSTRLTSSTCTRTCIALCTYIHTLSVLALMCVRVDEPMALVAHYTVRTLDHKVASNPPQTKRDRRTGLL